MKTRRIYTTPVSEVLTLNTDATFLTESLFYYGDTGTGSVYDDEGANPEDAL